MATETEQGGRLASRSPHFSSFPPFPEERGWLSITTLHTIYYNYDIIITVTIISKSAAIICLLKPPLLGSALASPGRGQPYMMLQGIFGSVEAGLQQHTLHIQDKHSLVSSFSYIKCLSSQTADVVPLLHNTWPAQYMASIFPTLQITIVSDRL